jgi:Fic family protein
MQPAGYQWLIEQLNLNVVPHHCRSFVSDKNIHRTVQKAGLTEEYYPKSKSLDNSTCGHLEFAVKNEGINLAVLKACFLKINAPELTEYVHKKPTGRFGRILWFLYEELTGSRLDIPDLKQGNYVDLLNPDKYFTGISVPHPRQRINMNLPGTLQMSPILRRAPKIADYQAKKLNEKCEKIIAGYPPELRARAVNQMYLGETRASNQIESEVLSPDRERRFKRLLEKAGTERFLNQDGLLNLHRQIVVDPRYQTDSYRTTQEYVGTGSLYTDAEIHFIPPRPQELPELMKDFFDCATRMMESDIHPVVTAAALSFLFVYLHPFRDGNGRLHRFLIHHILATTGFVPKGQIFPVSQVLRDDIGRYKEILNTFSDPFMEHVRYTMDSLGHITVQHDTSEHYRYIDLTAATEFLFAAIEKTLDHDLIQQLNFLVAYDRAEKELTRLFDGMSGREIDLLIKLCRQNKYTLAKNKREKFFPMLTPPEIQQAEQIIQSAFESEAYRPTEDAHETISTKK